MKIASNWSAITKIIIQILLANLFETKSAILNKPPKLHFSLFFIFFQEIFLQMFISPE